MGKKLKSIIVNLLTRWLEDLFIVAGVSVVVATTYINFGQMVGNYLLGAVLLVFGLLIAKK